MFNSKYSKFLTVLLVIAVLAIIAVLGYIGYDVFMKYNINNQAEEAISQFDTIVSEENNNQKSDNTVIEGVDDSNVLQNPTSGGSGKATYQGYDMAGYIEIPKIDIKYPVLDSVSKQAIKVAVAILYGPGLNQVGNTVIIGHNYRNGLFFSNLKKLDEGDAIYITDDTGNKVKYTVYSVYDTESTDATYMNRDTGDRREISLSTCTDDGSLRTIVWAKAD